MVEVELSDGWVTTVEVVRELGGYLVCHLDRGQMTRRLDGGMWNTQYTEKETDRKWERQRNKEK